MDLESWNTVESALQVQTQAIHSNGIEICAEKKERLKPM